MTYEANQTVYHMGQGVTFLAYIGEDRALVEVDVYDGDSEAFDQYQDNGRDLYTHSVTALVDVGALTDKKDDLWPIAKVERAKQIEILDAVKTQIGVARTEERKLRESARKLQDEAKKYEALDMILREMGREATHYIYCYNWYGDPEVIPPKNAHQRSRDITVSLKTSGSTWEVSHEGFRNGDAHYIPCFGPDDLAAKLVAFCERRVAYNDRAMSVKLEEFCTEYNVTSPKITAAIQKRKELNETKKNERIAKAQAELAKLQA